MKKIILLFTLLCFTTLKETFAQKDYNNMLSIEIPKEWKNQSKFLYRLVKVINWHIPEMAKKRVCFHCDAGYKIKFYVSPATVDFMYYNQGSSYEFTTLFTFFSYMDVIDSANKIFHRLVLTDSPAVHSIRYNMAKGGVTAPPVQNSIGALKNNALPALAAGERELRIIPEERIYNMSVLSNRFDDIAFIKANRGAMTPTETQLWGKVQEIIQAFNIPDETVSGEMINTKDE